MKKYIAIILIALIAVLVATLPIPVISDTPFASSNVTNGHNSAAKINGVQVVDANNINGIDVPIPRDNLVLYLPMWHTDLDADPFTSKDDYGHTIDVVSGATWTSLGYTYNGTQQYLRVTSSTTPFEVAGAQSACAWIKPDASQANYSTIFYIGDSEWTRRATLNLQWAADSTPNFEITRDDDNQRVAWGPGTFTADTWQFVVGTWDGANNVICYLDASPGTTETGATSIKNSGDYTVISSQADFLDFAGEIGEVIFYSKCLSQAEITAIYNTTAWRYE